MTNLDGYHGISKVEAVEKLNQMGYPAVWDKGVVEIALEHDGITHTVKEMKEVLDKIDYRMSYGFSYKPTPQKAEISV